MPRICCCSHYERAGFSEERTNNVDSHNYFDALLLWAVASEAAIGALCVYLQRKEGRANTGCAIGGLVFDYHRCSHLSSATDFMYCHPL